MKKTLILLTTALGCQMILAQNTKDNADFKEKRESYYTNTIQKSLDAKEESKPAKEFRINLEGKEIPNKVSLYKRQWSFPPISQGRTGTCWCFSATSFYESEIKRLSNKEIKLSEMFTVYNEYVEKTKEFIETRGTSTFAEGSQSGAVRRMMKQYGAMPYEVFSGFKNKNQQFPDHEKMIDEMNTFLQNVKKTNDWDKEKAISTIKSIMEHYIGTPPSSFKYENKEYTPTSFFKEVVKLDMDNYVDIYSIKQQPYWQQVEYEVADNWWHGKNYYNVPLDVYMQALKAATKANYTVVVAGDISECGFDKWSQCAIVPTFDIPSEYIDENARQMRFLNGSTTDDHGLHLVGYVENFGKDKKSWFLIKDSGSGSRNNDKNAPEFGYYFFNEDYIKLKIMYFTVHKDAVKDILSKFKGEASKSNNIDNSKNDITNSK